MTVQDHATGQSVSASQNWYSRAPAQVAADLGVDPAVGLTAARGASVLTTWALIPAVALLLLWELGKYVARRQQKTTQVTDLSATS